MSKSNRGDRLYEEKKHLDNRVKRLNQIFSYDEKKNYKYKNHSTLCSCSICGNPRNTGWGNSDDKVTKQERIAKIREEEQVNDKYRD